MNFKDRVLDRVAPVDPIESKAHARERYRNDVEYFQDLAIENSKRVKGFVSANLTVEEAGQSRDNLAHAENKIKELKQRGPGIIGRRRLFGRVPLWKTEVPLPG